MVFSPAPSAPANVWANLVTSYSIALQWVVSCEGQNGDISGYSVKYGALVGGGIKTVMNITEFGVTEIIIFNLMKSTFYSFEVAAINSAGRGVFSNATIIKTVEQSEFKF